MVKRVILGIFALLLIAAGAGAGVIAAWANGEFGPAGAMTFDAGTIVPAEGSQATVIDIERFDATIPFIGPLGTTTLSVSTGEAADPSDTLFIGAGSTADVDAYLKGAPYTVAIRSGSAWTTREVPGGVSPPLPREQDFWLEDAVGRHPDISVPDQRPLTVAVMHPAGLPTGPVTLGIDFRVPDAASWIRGFAIASVVLLLLGAILLVVAVRGGRRRAGRGRHEAGALAEAAAPEAAAVDAVAEPADDGVEEITDDEAADEVAADDEATDDEATDDEATDDVAADDAAADDAADVVATEKVADDEAEDIAEVVVAPAEVDVAPAAVDVAPAEVVPEPAVVEGEPVAEPSADEHVAES